MKNTNAETLSGPIEHDRVQRIGLRLTVRMVLHRAVSALLTAMKVTEDGFDHGGGGAAAPCGKFGGPSGKLDLAAALRRGTAGSRSRPLTTS